MVQLCTIAGYTIDTLFHILVCKKVLIENPAIVRSMLHNVCISMFVTIEESNKKVGIMKQFSHFGGMNTNEFKSRTSKAV